MSCAPMTKPNVLFIAVDDLRAALGCYGDEVAITPHIDRLAARGTVFKRAYCQQAVCNPSRASLMTGLRPDTIKVWDLKSRFRHELPAALADLPQYGGGTHFRRARPDVITLPEYVKQQGYIARSVGKIYHGSPGTQDAQSWSVEPQLNVVWKSADYLLPDNQAPAADKWPGYKMAATEAADVPDNAYGDGKVAEAACQLLGEYGEQPFFLAVGFRKPHLPFSAPKRYWDLYAGDAIPPPENPNQPGGIPDYAWHNSRELRGYSDVPAAGPLPDALIRRLRQGYYACVSYMDAQVGKLLDSLEAQGLLENTIIALWGDHGYHLGEKSLWGKTTNYELDTRAPLIVSAPGAGSGECDALVEFVDIYPTLVELCGLPVPAELEGSSLVPLLQEPRAPWKAAAFSQFPRPWPYHGEPAVMGYTMRTRRYRYTEWQDFQTGAVLANELYDHSRDQAEAHNASEDERYRETDAELSNQLRAGWRAALPKGCLQEDAATTSQAL
ncbi:MAG: sulfatase [Chloroflexi bacterium]|nr:sulfatase [Chloroflexota bacterium]